MDTTINFEDTLFIINMRLRMLQNMLKLNASPVFFKTVTLHDLDFIDKGLDNLLALLEKNPHYIDRETLFHTMQETYDTFSGLLQDFAEADDAVFKDRVLKITENTRLQKAKIGEEIQSFSGSTLQEPVVSSQELTELLKGLA